MFANEALSRFPGWESLMGLQFENLVAHNRKSLWNLLKLSLDENVIGYMKRFKILSDRYRNRRKRFGLRLNLTAGIYNYELI